MELTKEDIKEIKSAFQRMQTIDDLLIILNVVKPFVYGKETKPFKLQQLTYYAWNSKIIKYTTFEVKKKSGGSRTIHAPVRGLKAIQKVLAFVLQCVFEPHSASQGFTKGKSIIDNAEKHTRQRFVYNIDLKDFFPSIDQARIWKCLQLTPFNLNKESSKKLEFKGKARKGKRELKLKNGGVIYYRVIGNGTKFIVDKDKTDYKAINRLADKFEVTPNTVVNYLVSNSVKNTENNRLAKLSRLNIANLIAALCCTEMMVERKNENGEWIKVKKKVLPQGAPTSPVLTNVVCKRLDYLLTGVAKRFGLNYSRYADDITFSSQHNVYRKNSTFIKELNRIILDQHFHIKESKVRLQKNGYRQEVTGITVNEKPNVPKRYVKQLRQWLYYWERYGFDRFNSYFLPKQMADKGCIYKNGTPNMANVLAGKLDYLKMVRGGDDFAYLGLKERFDRLVDSNNLITTVLEAWKEKDINEAMKIYRL